MIVSAPRKVRDRARVPLTHLVPLFWFDFNGRRCAWRFSPEQVELLTRRGRSHTVVATFTDIETAETLISPHVGTRVMFYALYSAARRYRCALETMAEEEGQLV